MAYRISIGHHMPTVAKSWFEVDRQGLADILARHEKSLVISELLQNSWDEPGVTQVSVIAERVPGTRNVRICVEDDAPAGFENLATAYTMVAKSKKLADATLRGRFGIGEKRAMAISIRAKIVSTRGGWMFDARGRHSIRERRESGSLIELIIPIDREELDACERLAHRMLPPDHLLTTYNGQVLAVRQPLQEVEATLPTEVSDGEGRLRTSQRTTTIRILRAVDASGGWLYEMGVPVVQTGDPYDVDVCQRVPLNTDRDNVTPAYLRKIRKIVLERMHGELDQEGASSPWVREALEDPTVDAKAVHATIRARFGDKAVIFDPSDMEANKLAVSKEFVVVHGGHLSAAEWANVRRVGALLPAGQVTPSPKPYGDGPPVRLIPRDQWTAGMNGVVQATRRIARTIAGFDPTVVLENEPKQRYRATFGGRQFAYNVGVLGTAWFDQPDPEDVIALILHELAHSESGDHLSERYHKALCRLGARLALACATDPALIDLGAGKAQVVSPSSALLQS